MLKYDKIVIWGTFQKYSINFERIFRDFYQSLHLTFIYKAKWILTLPPSLYKNQIAISYIS